MLRAKSKRKTTSPYARPGTRSTRTYRSQDPPPTTSSTGHASSTESSHAATADLGSIAPPSTATAGSSTAPPTDASASSTSAKTLRSSTPLGDGSSTLWLYLLCCSTLLNSPRIIVWLWPNFA
ncbi:uncharacterized protein LOC134250109 isoform X2 [Saccostrea cucullata]|uniref:uncharacterized protein LOC134250109 isoform X2 n=1 Tax=Saccostrea cuccullata TaxID=36930 RepID=UPI002ED64E2E